MVVDTQDAGSVEAIAGRLRPDEPLEISVRADGSSLGVTAERVVVAIGDRVTLDVPIAGLRRLQLDIERDRPAVLAVVPESIRDEPQILTVMPQAYDDVAAAVAFVGHRLHELTGAD
jgi:hypothetical protein